MISAGNETIEVYVFVLPDLLQILPFISMTLFGIFNLNYLLNSQSSQTLSKVLENLSSNMTSYSREKSRKVE